MYTTATVLGSGEQEGIWWDVVLLVCDPVSLDEVQSVIVLHGGCPYVLQVFKFLLTVIL